MWLTGYFDFGVSALLFSAWIFQRKSGINVSYSSLGEGLFGLVEYWSKVVCGNRHCSVSFLSSLFKFRNRCICWKGVIVIGYSVKTIDWMWEIDNIGDPAACKWLCILSTLTACLQAAKLLVVAYCSCIMLVSWGGVSYKCTHEEQCAGLVWPW